MSIKGITTKFEISRNKRPPAKPFAWVADVRFYHKINYERLKKSGGQKLVAEKKCIVWNPNILHKEKIRIVVN